MGELLWKNYGNYDTKYASLYIEDYIFIFSWNFYQTIGKKETSFAI